MTPDAPASADDAFLEDCLVQWLERAGTTTAADLDALCAARPHLLGRLRAMAAVAADLPGGESDDPLLGTLLGDRYRVTGRLGAGGMGLVYAARDERLGREVALKVLDELFARDAQRVERFRREAQHLAALQHPHIVAVHDLQLHARPPFLVMDRVDGFDLAALVAVLRELTPAGAVPGSRELTAALVRLGAAASSGAGLQQLTEQPWPRTVAELGQQMGSALSAAHAIGVVHRDIKPSNFMLGRDGRVRLLDFGLATHAADASLTRSDTRLGTPLYMAPEQVRGSEATARSDVYALGGSLYELACLQPPFGARGTDLETQILYEDPAPPHTVCPRLPRDLGAICLHALAKAPGGRYGDVAALLADLERFARFEPVAARQRAWPAPLRRAVGIYRRYRTVLVGAALICVVAAAVAMFAGHLWGAGDARAQATAAAARADRARQLHAGLSPYLGFGGSRADRLADPHREAALAALDQLVELDPRDAVARFLRVWVRGEETPVPPQVAVDLAALETQLGAARATRLYREVALPLQQRERGDCGKARIQLTAALAAAVADAPPLDALGRRLQLTLRLQMLEVDSEQRQQHVAQARELLAGEPLGQRSAFSCMAHGVVLMVDQLLVRAKEEYQECDRLCPAQPATLHALARLHRLLGDPEAALPYSAAALAVAPDPHPNYREQHALVLMALGEFGSAAALLERYPSDGEFALSGALLRARLYVQQASVATDATARAAALAAGAAVLTDVAALLPSGAAGSRQAAALQRYRDDVAALAGDDAARQVEVVTGLLLDAGSRGAANPLNTHLLRSLSDALRRDGQGRLAELFAQQAATLEARRIGRPQ